MVARAYHDLGAVNGETVGSKVPYSSRGSDRNQTQNFVFECNETQPFTGTVYLQISQEEPPQKESRNDPVTGDNLVWTDVARLEFDDEGGNIFLQINIEAAMIRRVCKPGDYVSGRIDSIWTMR